MLLADSILWALYEECIDVNFADIYCDDSIKEEVKAALTGYWIEERLKDWEALPEAYTDEDCGGDENEIEYNSNYSESDVCIESTDFGLRFKPGCLYVEGNGRWCYNIAFCRAFGSALARIKKEFPGIKYYAYIGYAWSDDHLGEVEQEEFNSEGEDTSEMTYEYVGNALKFIDSDELIDRLNEYDLDNLADVLKSLRMYIDYVPYTTFENCKLLEYATKIGDIAFLTAASKYITKDNIDEFIDTAQENKKTECTAWLLNFKNDNIRFDSSYETLE